MKIYQYEYDGEKMIVETFMAKETPKMYKIPFTGGWSGWWQIRKDEIGEVSGLRYGEDVSLYLTERDDEKARDLFFKYFDTRISESVKEKEEIDKRISKFAEAKDKVLEIRIKEKEVKE